MVVVLERVERAVEGSIVAGRAAGDFGAGDVGAGDEETGGVLGREDAGFGGLVGRTPCMSGPKVDTGGPGDSGVGSGEERGETGLSVGSTAGGLGAGTSQG